MGFNSGFKGLNDSLVKQFKETPLIISPTSRPDPELDQSSSHSKMSDPF